MARSQIGATLTERHRQRQLALRAQTLRDFMRLWPLWSIEDSGSFDRLVTATVPLVALRRRTSAGLAVDYYTAFRVAEEVGGSPTPRLAPTIDRDKLVTSLFVTGQAQARRSLAAGFAPEAVRQTSLISMSGAVSRHVLDGGRETLLASAAADPKSGRWQRITASKPCAFCAMIASRGAVFTSDTAGFRSHDHCACTAEPFYDGSTVTARNRQFGELWDEAQREASAAGELRRGTSNDALNAFRRAYTSA